MINYFLLFDIKPPLMISINAIIFSKMSGEVHCPIRDVTDHLPDIRHPDNKIQEALYHTSWLTDCPLS